MRPGLLSAALLTTLTGVPAAAAPTVHTVVVERMKFGPLPAGLRAGDSILWVNRDPVRHSATARDGSFDLDLPAKASGRTVIRKKGSIPFVCRYHPGMKGVLVAR